MARDGATLQKRPHAQGSIPRRAGLEDGYTHENKSTRVRFLAEPSSHSTLLQFKQTFGSNILKSESAK